MKSGDVSAASAGQCVYYDIKTLLSLHNMSSIVTLAFLKVKSEYFVCISAAFLSIHAMYF